MNPFDLLTKMGLMPPECAAAFELSKLAEATWGIKKKVTHRATLYFPLATQRVVCILV